jgi:hypothetical protein
MLNSINRNSVVGIYSEVKEIKCKICGKTAIVTAYAMSECQECEQDMYGTISGFDVEEYNELKELHIGKEESVNVDNLIAKLTDGDKYVLVAEYVSRTQGIAYKAKYKQTNNVLGAKRYSNLRTATAAAKMAKFGYRPARLAELL